MTIGEKDTGGPPVYNIAKSLMRTVRGEAILRTVVGPGFAICVTLSNGVGGGLYHMFLSGNKLECDLSQMQRRLDRFIDSLKKVAPLNNASFDVIGGADILKIYPGSARFQQAEACKGLIVDIFEKEGMKVRRVTVGGVLGRTVKFNTVTGRAEVTLAGGAREPGPRPSFRPTGDRTVKSNVPEVQPSWVGREGEVSVNMGFMHVGKSPLRLVATLGSCVGVAIYDPKTKIGGLAHVMMPNFSDNGDPLSKFADTAVGALVDEMVKQGANRNTLIAKLAGGSNILFRQHEGGIYRIADRNIDNTRNSLKEAGIRVLQENVGGRIGRKIAIDLEDFDMKIKMLIDQNEDLV